MVLSQAQKDEINQFRDQALALRLELRDVQFQLRRDVEQVTGWVKVINIGAVPALVAVFALILAFARRSMLRRAAHA